MLDLDQLKTFLVAAELGNFTHAARRLHLSQSAVSQQIREIENQLGCPLFVRKSRSIGLTPAGEHLLPRARKLLDDARATADAVRVVGSGPQGVVRVAASPLAALGLLVPVLGEFTDGHPGIRVQVDTYPADMVADVYRDDAYDAAVTEGRVPGIRPSTITLLRREPVVAVAPVAWFRPAAGSAADRLAGVPVIAWPEDSAIGAVVRRGLTAAGVDLETVGTRALVADALVQASAVAAEVGVAFVPHLAAAADLTSGKVVRWEVPGFEVSIDLWALASNQDGAAKVFLEWLRERVGSSEPADLPRPPSADVRGGGKAARMGRTRAASRIA